MLDDRSALWDKAACTTYGYPDMWHGDGETANQGDTLRAINICKKCDIRTDCFEYAYLNGLCGIWGATTTKQRKRMRDDKRKAGVR